MYSFDICMPVCVRGFTTEFKIFYEIFTLKLYLFYFHLLLQVIVIMTSQSKFMFEISNDWIIFCRALCVISNEIYIIIQSNASSFDLISDVKYVFLAYATDNSVNFCEWLPQASHVKLKMIQIYFMYVLDSLNQDTIMNIISI